MTVISAKRCGKQKKWFLYLRCVSDIMEPFSQLHSTPLCVFYCMLEAGKPKSTDWVLESPPVFQKWKHCLEARSEVEWSGHIGFFLVAVIAEVKWLVPRFVLLRGRSWDTCFVSINQGRGSLALEPTMLAQFPDRCISVEATWSWSQQLRQGLPKSSSSWS